MAVLDDEPEKMKREILRLGEKLTKTEQKSDAAKKKIEELQREIRFLKDENTRVERETKREMDQMRRDEKAKDRQLEQLKKDKRTMERKEVERVKAESRKTNNTNEGLFQVRIEIIIIEFQMQN